MVAITKPGWNTTVVVNGTAPIFATSGSDYKVPEVDPNDLTSKIICYALISVFFGFFIGVVFADMRRKYISGDFQDDIRGIGAAVSSLFKGIGKGLVMLTSKKTWYWFIRIFKGKKAEKDVEKAPERNLESQAIIDRLAAKPAGSVPEVTEVSKTTTASTIASTSATVVALPLPVKPEVIVTPPSPVGPAPPVNDGAYDSDDSRRSSVYSIEPSAIN